MGKLNAVRCDDDFQQALEDVAKARGWSVPGLFREAARQYIQGDELHRAMVDLEKRQAGSFKALHNEVRRMRSEMRELMTMHELFIKSYYVVLLRAHPTYAGGCEAGGEGSGAGALGEVG